jgi:hypothetical protein
MESWHEPQFSVAVRNLKYRLRILKARDNSGATVNEPWTYILSPMRTVRTLAILAFCHLALTVLLLTSTFASGIARFDSGEPIGPIERGASAVLSVLSFPLVSSLLRGRAPVPWYFEGILGHVPFALNSLLWAAVILAGISLYRRYRAEGIQRSGLW